jgi:hypothetical protein
LIPLDTNQIVVIDASSMIQNLDLLFDQAHLKLHHPRLPSADAVYYYHAHSCDTLSNYIEQHRNLGQGFASASSMKQLILLCHTHAMLEDYCSLVYPLQSFYATRKEGLSDPRRTKLTISTLAEITRDALFYEEVNERVVELAGAVDASVESLKILLMDTANFRDFQSLAATLQSTGTDLKRIMFSLSSTLEYHLRLFELSRGMHEAESVRLLSILASIFLPLSLACGLLSMQTRFADLHYLLYDFFGVLILLGTAVIVILLVLRFHLWTKELLAQLNRSRMFRVIVWPNGRIAIFCLSCLGWGLLLSSFLVGMVKDVGLGLKILGYGVSAAAGISLLILVCLASITLILLCVLNT